MQKQCLFCETVFEAVGNRLYCSDHCQNNSKKKHDREKWLINKFKHIRHPDLYNKLKQCIICSNSFRSDIRHPQQNTCGKKKCSKKYSYEKNKDKYLPKRKERYERIKNSSEYKEKARMAAKKWRLNNPEKAKEIYRKYNLEHKSEILAKLRKYELKERICAFCGSSFMPDRNHPLAECHSQKCRNKFWAKRNPEKSKQINIAKSKRYRERHPEKIKEFTRKLVESGKANINAKRWRERHLEKAKELRKKQYWKNRERELKKVKEWRRTEAGKISHRASEKNRQFKEKSKLIIDFPVTRAIQDKIRQRDKDLCVYCHKKPDEITFDHIISQYNEGNNSINNLVVACMSCNGSKRHILLEDWFRLEYCKLNNITNETINPIVWKLLKKQKEQIKI